MPLKELVRRTLRRTGIDIVRYRPDHFSALRADLLREHGVHIALDVGANVGGYGRMIRQQGFDGRIVSFEPDGPAFTTLRAVAAGDPRWECRRAALGRYDGLGALRRSENTFSSSLLEVRARHVAAAPRSRVVGSVDVEVRRLDTFRSEFVGANDSILLKLDVQGYELEALEGAKETLAQVAVVETELSVVELYEGQPLIGDVLAWLAGHGFVPVALRDAFTDPRTGELLQLDGLLVRRTSEKSA